MSCRQYGQGVDMWASACIIAEMFRRQPLFQAEGDVGQLNAIVEKLGSPEPSLYERLEAQHQWAFKSMHAQPMEELLPNAREEVLELVVALLDFDPARRPSAAEVLQHRYLADVPADESEEGRAAQARRAADIERLRHTAPSARPVNGNLNGVPEHYMSWRMAQRAIRPLDGDSEFPVFGGIEGLRFLQPGFPIGRTGRAGLDTAGMPSASKRVALDLSAAASSTRAVGGRDSVAPQEAPLDGGVGGVGGVPGGASSLEDRLGLGVEKRGGSAAGAIGGRHGHLASNTPSALIIGDDPFEPILHDSLVNSGSSASLRGTPGPGGLSEGSHSRAPPDAMDITPAPRIAINFSTPDHGAPTSANAASSMLSSSGTTTSSGSAQLNATVDSDSSFISASARMNGLARSPIAAANSPAHRSCGCQQLQTRPRPAARSCAAYCDSGHVWHASGSSMLRAVFAFPIARGLTCLPWFAPLAGSSVGKRRREAEQWDHLDMSISPH
jgi:hypothetical protein